MGRHLSRASGLAGMLLYPWPSVGAERRRLPSRTDWERGRVKADSREVVSGKDRKPVAAALTEIYRAVDADAGEAALTAFEEGYWRKKYPAIGQSWRRAWAEVIPFLPSPERIPAGGPDTARLAAMIYSVPTWTYLSRSEYGDFVQEWVFPARPSPGVGTCRVLHPLGVRRPFDCAAWRQHRHKQDGRYERSLLCHFRRWQCNGGR